jgi:uncharacterized Zn-binding protein involved in type VI secretion
MNMPNAPLALVGTSTVNGGAITGPGDTGLINGVTVSVVGDLIATHPAAPFGPGFHTGATVTQGSSVVKANGIPVSYIGSLCSCGHQIDAGGSTNVTVPE